MHSCVFEDVCEGLRACLCVCAVCVHINVCVSLNVLGNQPLSALRQKQINSSTGLRWNQWLILPSSIRITLMRAANFCIHPGKHLIKCPNLRDYLTGKPAKEVVLQESCKLRVCCHDLLTTKTSKAYKALVQNLHDYRVELK